MRGIIAGSISHGIPVPDLTGAIAIFALHKIVPDYAGTCIQNDSGDMGFDENGELDWPLVANGSPCFKWYDQSGNAHNLRGDVVGDTDPPYLRTATKELSYV